MNIVQAVETARLLNEANGVDWWFRPKSWKGSGIALAYSGSKDSPDLIIVVPHGPSGAFPAQLPRGRDIVGDWEVVSPDQVLKEKES